MKLTQKKVHEKTLYRNWDEFGTEMFYEKFYILLAQSEQNEKIYDEILKKNLYEHPILSNPNAGVKDGIVAKADVKKWSDVFKRNYKLGLGLWQLYYSVREKKLSGAIDHQLRKYVNFVCGGGILKHLEKVEKSFLEDFAKLYKKKSIGIHTDLAEEIGEMSEKYQKSVIQHAQAKNKLKMAGTYGNAITAALNIWIAAVAFQKAYDKDGTTEDKMKAYLAGISALGKVGVTIAKFRGIQVGLSKSVLKAATKAGVKRTALTLGIYEAAFGGAGGIIGMAWYIYDAITSYGRGNRKEAFWNSVAAVGCAIATLGLFLDGTILGAPAGVVLNIIGLVIVIVAEVIKIFGLHSSQIETWGKDLYRVEYAKGGMERMKVWFEEIKAIKVRIPWSSMADIENLKKLTDRVDEFLVNWDTYDQINNESYLKAH